MLALLALYLFVGRSAGRQPPQAGSWQPSAYQLRLDAEVLRLRHGLDGAPVSAVVQKASWRANQ